MSQNSAEEGQRPQMPFVSAMFPQRSAPGEPAPGRAECVALWDKYQMLPHIREHSERVAQVADWLAGALGSGQTCRGLALAGALLHDLAKSYTIQNGGSHAQLGAGWVVRETGNRRLAQVVYHHVHWPWELDVDNESMLPSLLVLYADKRVKHSRIVGLDERFADLFRRYGVDEEARRSIARSREQGRIVENALAKRLGVALHEHSFDCRRLV